MLEEITFGKDGSKFVVNQNIALDDLIEGKKTKQGCIITLYNTAKLFSSLPELEFDPLIIDENEKPIAPLVADIYDTGRSTRILLTLACAGITAEMADINVVPFNNAIEAILGGITPNAARYVYNRFSKKRQAYKQTITEEITGTNFYSNSIKQIDMLDSIFVNFGSYRFKTTITRPDKHRNINRERLKEIQEIIAFEQEQATKKDHVRFYETLCGIISPWSDIISLQNSIGMSN